MLDIKVKYSVHPEGEMGCPGERWGARGRDEVPGGEMGCPGERWGTQGRDGVPRVEMGCPG